jgi:flagellar motility protein MotE (MotC chaperone)
MTAPSPPARAEAALRLLPVLIACMLGAGTLKLVTLLRAAPALAAPAAEPAAPRPPAASAPAASQPAPRQPSAAPPAAPAAEQDMLRPGERALLLQLRERRAALEAREQELQAREALAVAAERKIAARVEELAALQARLEEMENRRQQREEENWRGLVKLYETMKPRDAAAIMNDLDMPVLLAVVDRMREAKAAPILAAMQPDRARLLTAELAQLRRRGTTPPAATAQAAATPGPAPRTATAPSR